jgi:ABC-2 type transport system ATP-binding protein
VGAPRLQLSYHGTVDRGERPTRVFAQLVDEAAGLTVGNQITPIEVTLDGETHTAEVPLEVVSHALTRSSRLTLQLVATTVAYARPRLGGSVTFESIDVSLPVAESGTTSRR